MGNRLETYLLLHDRAVLVTRAARGYVRAKVSPARFGPLPLLLGHVRLHVRGNATFGARLLVEAHTWAVGITVAEGATLTVGNGVFINGGTSIEAWHEVHIGHHVLMAPFVSIIDDDRHEIEPGTPLYKGPTVIGDGVWLGRNVVVLPGVTVGAGAVIGANSVVSRDIPPRTFAAGAPAKVIKTLDLPEGWDHRYGFWADGEDHRQGPKIPHRLDRNELNRKNGRHNVGVLRREGASHARPRHGVGR